MHFERADAAISAAMVSPEVRDMGHLEARGRADYFRPWLKLPRESVVPIHA
jgi:hypothetical protein